MAKSILDSPVWHLVHALASLTEDDGNTIAIDALQNMREHDQQEELADIEELRQMLGNKPWSEVLPGVRGGVRIPAKDMSEEEILKQYLYGASLNINILEAGDSGPEPRAFSLPHEARCRIDMRLPSRISTRETRDGIQKKLAESGYADIEVEIIEAYEAHQTDRASELARAIYKVFEQKGIPVITWGRM